MMRLVASEPTVSKKATAPHVNFYSELDYHTIVQKLSTHIVMT